MLCLILWSKLNPFSCSFVCSAGQGTPAKTRLHRNLHRNLQHQSCPIRNHTVDDIWQEGNLKRSHLQGLENSGTANHCELETIALARPRKQWDCKPLRTWTCSEELIGIVDKQLKHTKWWLYLSTWASLSSSWWLLTWNTSSASGKI